MNYLTSENPTGMTYGTYSTVLNQDHFLRRTNCGNGNKIRNNKTSRSKRIYCPENVTIHKSVSKDRKNINNDKQTIEDDKLEFTA